MRHQMVVAAGALAAVFFLAGCFTREESLLVGPDGSVLATVTMRGDEADYLSGEPLVVPAGWTASEETKTDQEGKREITAVWKAEMAGLDLYPHSFARPGDLHADASLQMLTTLEMEEHPDRMVYRFRRVFLGRRSGMYDRMRDSMIPSELQARADKDPGSLTPQEREKLFAGYASYESAALLLRARNALGRAVREGVLEPSAFGPALEALQTLLEERLSGEALQRFFLLPEDEQDAEMDRLRKDVRRGIETSAPPAARTRLRAILDHEDKTFEITQDLTDDDLLISVRLPGIVVEANSSEVQGSDVHWQVRGSDLMEGDLVLTAVSVAPR